MIILDNCNNLYGSLDKDLSSKIKNYISQPYNTSDEWNDIAHIIIDACDHTFTTIWQALIMLEPSFPQSGRSYDENGKIVKDWLRIPCGFDVARAIHEHNKNIINIQNNGG